MLKLKFVKDSVILDIFVKLNQNWSMSIDQVFFSQNSNFDIDFVPRMLKLELIQDIVIFNICVKIKENRYINAGVRVITMFFLN